MTNNNRHHPTCKCPEQFAPQPATADTTTRQIPTVIGEDFAQTGPLSDPCKIYAAAIDAPSVSAVLRELGVIRGQLSTRQLTNMCAAHGIALPVRAGRPNRPSPIDDAAQLRNAVAQATNTREAVQFLGLSSCGKTNKRFEQSCENKNIDLPWMQSAPGTVRQLNALPAERINAALSATTSNAQALEQLGINKDGNAYTWIQRRRCAAQ